MDEKKCLRKSKVNEDILFENQQIFAQNAEKEVSIKRDKIDFKKEFLLLKIIPRRKNICYKIFSNSKDFPAIQKREEIIKNVFFISTKC